MYVILFGLLIVLGALMAMFWLMMLVDCLKKQFKDNTEKIIWLLVIILLNFIGAIIYWSLVKRE